MDVRNAHSRTAMADRLVMVWMWLNGTSARRISRYTGASVSTVYRWIRRWYDEGTLETRPYCGRHMTIDTRKPTSVSSEYLHNLKLPATPNIPIDGICHLPRTKNNWSSVIGMGSIKMDSVLRHIYLTAPYYGKFS
ncbi:hypothetical protein Pmani_002238 [Petrolisthes manimaculis]|uniref:Uncharacterized protein n=1 Tax=Petrolisthes manimaculis TaxID=1843537 RepID=A0AAE1QLE2_9EUCA|nr:hypothetical protein Pmani_002238 [Petrolisthes manimaculis]